MRPPEVHPLVARMATGLLHLAGWHLEGDIPDIPKFVAVAAPHTSNWDGILAIIAALAFRIRFQWIGKHTLFRGPFGPLMRAFGGIPVNRHVRANSVEQMVEQFNQRERMILGVTPEGTRARVTQWKTGFYYIAQGADVPLVLAYLDYPRRVIGIGPTIIPTGDLPADLKQIQAFYADKTGRHPDRMTTFET